MGVRGFRRIPPIAAEARYTTPLGGFQRVVLSDGSIVQINTDSAVRVVLRKTERDIELVRGEACFEVARDASGNAACWDSTGRRLPDRIVLRRAPSR